MFVNIDNLSNFIDIDSESNITKLTYNKKSEN